MALSPWLMAARPRTLSLSVTPVLVGTAMAWAADGEVPWLAVLAALIASAFIQLGTNLHNDAADFERGSDGPDRIGPPRVTATGLLSATTVNRGAFVCFGIAALLGLYLTYVGGWPILLIGILSIAAGWGYTGGPYPIAYTPFGEVFVVAFFGVTAVAGTFFLCRGHISASALTSGLAIGSLTGAVLLVNNYRRIGRPRRAQNTAHRYWKRHDSRNLCRTDAAPVRIAPTGRQWPAARQCVARVFRPAVCAGIDLALCARATWTGLQPDPGANRASPARIQPAAIGRAPPLRTDSMRWRAVMQRDIVRASAGQSSWRQFSDR